MPYPRESLFRVLGIRVDASLREVLDAYARGVREGHAPRGVLAKMFHDARNPCTRAEASVLEYTAGKPPSSLLAELEGVASERLVPNSSGGIRVPLALTDVGGRTREADFLPLPARRVRLQSTITDVQMEDVLPPLEYPS